MGKIKFRDRFSTGHGAGHRNLHLEERKHIPKLTNSPLCFSPSVRLSSLGSKCYGNRMFSALGGLGEPPNSF